jgi:hypothetical protein
MCELDVTVRDFKTTETKTTAAAKQQ